MCGGSEGRWRGVTKGRRRSTFPPYPWNVYAIHDTSDRVALPKTWTFQEQTGSGGSAAIRRRGPTLGSFPVSQGHEGPHKKSRTQGVRLRDKSAKKETKLPKTDLDAAYESAACGIRPGCPPSCTAGTDGGQTPLDSKLNCSCQFVRKSALGSETASIRETLGNLAIQPELPILTCT